MNQKCPHCADTGKIFIRIRAHWYFQTFTYCPHCEIGRLVERVEGDAPNFEERLKAALRLAQLGFKVEDLGIPAEINGRAVRDEILAAIRR